MKLARRAMRTASADDSRRRLPAAASAERRAHLFAPAGARALPLRCPLHQRRFGRFALGQSTAEFALVLPLLLLVVIGLFWLSQLLEAYDFVSYAAQAATRYAIVRGATSPQPATTNDIAGVVTNMAAGLNPKQLTVTTTWTPNNQPGSTVEVQVQYAFQLPLPLMPSSAISLSASSEMVISQ